jgi:hypothetical protein
VNQAIDASIFYERYPQQWGVPVLTLWGSFSSATPGSTMFMEPLNYRGNLLKTWDPTNDADLAALRSFKADGTWWGADLVVKAEFSDGSVRHVLSKHYARNTDPLAKDSFTYWAINLPAVQGVSLRRVSLFHRPMEVRNSDNGNTASQYYMATNLNSSLSKNVTGATYLNGAKLVLMKDY